MSLHHHRAAGLSGLLTLVLLVACDSGSAPAKDAAPTKAAAAKTAGKAEPAKTETKVEPTPPVVATPTPEPTPTPVAVEPEPAPTTAVVEPDEPVPEPAPEPEPAADEPVDPPDDPSVVAEPAEPATAGSGSTPISLGPDAELLKLVLAHDVVNRQPVDPATTFPEGQKVSLFIEARNESGEDIRVKVTWEDTKSGRRSPPVGVVIAPRKLHRTRSYRTMKKAGEYRCIVLGDDDRELAVLPFTIE